MACPFFYPVEKSDDSAYAIPPRLPLGDAYLGECRAGETPFLPQEPRLGGACNNGYGRGACDRFPAEASADAVRFHIAETHDETIRIQYVLEKGCWPAGYGELECSAGRFNGRHENPILQRQAEAFLESYLRRAAELGPPTITVAASAPHEDRPSSLPA